MSEIDKLHYPERLGLLFVINTPSVVQQFYRLVYFLVPPDVRSRILILGGKETMKTNQKPCATTQYSFEAMKHMLNQTHMFGTPAK